MLAECGRTTTGVLEKERVYLVDEVLEKSVDFGWRHSFTFSSTRGYFSRTSRVEFE